MIDFETIEFIGMLNEMAAKSKNGIKPFGEATYENFHDYIFYDDSAGAGENKFRIVQDACLVCDHHDVISYFEGYQECDAFVCVEDDDLSAQIWFPMINSWIIVENGRWYTC